jgi:hypothetical protein
MSDFFQIVNETSFFNAARFIVGARKIEDG